MFGGGGAYLPGPTGKVPFNLLTKVSLAQCTTLLEVALPSVVLDVRSIGHIARKLTLSLGFPSDIVQGVRCRSGSHISVDG